MFLHVLWQEAAEDRDSAAELPSSTEELGNLALTDELGSDCREEQLRVGPSAAGPV